jgi:hypothetical protein
MRCLALAVWACLAAFSVQAAEPPAPVIDGEWWTIAGDPDLGPLTSPKQQPVDFAVWQAADGTWQLWSCIRSTLTPGKTRLFHRWEGKNLTDPNWTPKGITMEADPKLGETQGGLQAPYVFKVDDTYFMLYGDWENICLATSKDGKQFTRKDVSGGKPALFTEIFGANTRDPMAIRVGDRWLCYYTAYPNEQGAVYCRISPNLLDWSETTTVAFGGQSGTGPFSSECPFVVQYHNEYYLFRTQRYGENAQTSIYRSNDPLNFGLNQDRRFFVKTLPIAAPEILLHDGQYYIAALRPDLKGIQIAKLKWTDGE